MDLDAFTPGAYVLVADYDGDGFYVDALDPYTVIAVTVPKPHDPNEPTFAFTASPAPSWYSQPVILTLTQLSPIQASAYSGVVMHYDGLRQIGSAGFSPFEFAPGEWTAQANLTVTNLSVGIHSITAEFFRNEEGSRQLLSLSHVVHPNETVITLVSPQPSTPYGEVATFDVSVAGLGTPVTAVPTGYVSIYDDGDYLGSVELDGLGAGTFEADYLPHGSQTLTAIYVGDAVYRGSENTLGHLITNHAPVGGDDRITTTIEQPVKLFLLSNDTDDDFDLFTITGNSGPLNGTVQITDGVALYTPDPGFVGTDTFTYTVSYGFGGTATATATVRVLPQGAGSRVFADANGDGVQDPDDRGVPFTTVQLLDRTGAVVATVVTDANGYYELPTMPIDHYRLRFLPPTPLARTPFSPRSPESTVDADGYTGWFNFDTVTGWPDLCAGIVLDPTDPAYGWLFP